MPKKIPDIPKSLLADGVKKSERLVALDEFFLTLRQDNFATPTIIGILKTIAPYFRKTTILHVVSNHFSDDNGVLNFARAHDLSAATKKQLDTIYGDIISSYSDQKPSDKRHATKMAEMAISKLASERVSRILIKNICSQAMNFIGKDHPTLIASLATKAIAVCEAKDRPEIIRNALSHIGADRPAERKAILEQTLLYWQNPKTPVCGEDLLDIVLEQYHDEPHHIKKAISALLPDTINDKARIARLIKILDKLYDRGKLDLGAWVQKNYLDSTSQKNSLYLRMFKKLTPEHSSEYILEVLNNIAEAGACETEAQKKLVMDTLRQLFQHHAQSIGGPVTTQILSAAQACTGYEEVGAAVKPTPSPVQTACTYN